MAAAREKDQADFDFERFINMFDEALTSKDPRVIETLRSLMMIVTLTRPESYDEKEPRRGPLRRAFEDMNHMWKRMEQMEEELRQMHQRMSRESSWGKDVYRSNDYEKYTLAAASQMAQQIDQDLIRQFTQKINTPISPKGLLKK